MAEQESRVHQEFAAGHAASAEAVAAMARAQHAADAVTREVISGAGRAVVPRPLQHSAGEAGNGLRPASDISFLSDVNLKVRIELGRTRMYVEDVLRLDRGSVVELDKPAGEPVDVFINDQLIARGEVVVLNDTFCVRVTEIIPGARVDL